MLILGIRNCLISLSQITLFRSGIGKPSVFLVIKNLFIRKKKGNTLCVPHDEILLK